MTSFPGGGAMDRDDEGERIEPHHIDDPEGWGPPELPDSAWSPDEAEVVPEPELEEEDA